MNGIGTGMIMSERVDTKRSPSVAAGKRGSPTTFLTSVPCTSLLPVSQEIAARIPNRAPAELLQCFVPGEYDVKEGDFIVFNSKEYPVRDAAEWQMRRITITHLILEDIKAN